MAKTYIGCEKYHGEPKFYVADCDECRSDLVTLPGTDIYFSDATVEWIATQTEAGNALARLEAARQEGVISSYCLLSPSVLCGQWEAGIYVAGGVHEYQPGATLAAALTAAADYADGLRAQREEAAAKQAERDAIGAAEDRIVACVKEGLLTGFSGPHEKLDVLRPAEKMYSYQLLSTSGKHFDSGWDTRFSAATRAADWCEALRTPPLPDVDSMSIEAMAAELNSYGAKVGLLCATDASNAKYSCWILASGDCYAEGHNHWTRATRLALTAAREQQK